MIKFIAKIGRLDTVAIITLAASAISFVLTTLTVTWLNAFGMDLSLTVAATLASAIPLIVAPLPSWYLVGLLLKPTVSKKRCAASPVSIR